MSCTSPQKRYYERHKAELWAKKKAKRSTVEGHKFYNEYQHNYYHNNADRVNELARKRYLESKSGGIHDDKYLVQNENETKYFHLQKQIAAFLNCSMDKIRNAIEFGDSVNGYTIDKCW